MVTSLASIAVMVYAAFEWAYIAHHGATTTVAHAIVLDGFAVVGTFAIGAGMLLSAFVAHDWAKRERDRRGGLPHPRARLERRCAC